MGTILMSPYSYTALLIDVQLSSNSKKRFTFRVGDFLYTRKAQLCRLDHIFVHELLPGARRAFITASPVLERVVGWDTVLDLPLLELGERKMTFGLPAINSKRTWVVPVQHQEGSLARAESTSEGRLLMKCDWEIHFL